MTRREFVKMLLSMSVVVDGSVNALFKMLYQSFTSRTEQETKTDTVIEEVKPVASTEPLLSFFVLSDLHVSIYDKNTPRKLRNALYQIQYFSHPVDALLLGGDLTDYGTELEYKSLQSILSSYKLPQLYANMGNHDYYNIWIDKSGAFNTASMPNGKTDAESRERFQKMFWYTKPYNDFDIKGYHFILMSQESYLQEMPEVGEGAWYSDAQMAWLEAKLKETTDGKPIFVLIHQPLPAIGQDGGSHRLIRANQFREILKPYPNVFVISGHTHQDFDNGSNHYTKETFHWFVNASVGLTRNPEPLTKSQGMYVQVYEDKVTVRGWEFANSTWIPEADWTIPLEKVK